MSSLTACSYLPPSPASNRADVVALGLARATGFVDAGANDPPSLGDSRATYARLTRYGTSASTLNAIPSLCRSPSGDATHSRDALFRLT